MILVTGADGFIGRALRDRLDQAGLDVVGHVLGDRAEIRPGQWTLDLTRADHLQALGKASPVPDTIVHLAGRVEIALRANPEDPSLPPLPGEEDIARIYALNVGLTANLIQYALRAGVRHIVFASSQAVYGMPQQDVLTEESPCAPLEHYAASKLFCERMLEVASRPALSVTVLRFPGVYSEERRMGVVYRFFEAAFRSRQITVSADYPLPIDVIHRDDVLNAIEQVVRRGGAGFRILNIATGEPCSLDLLADAVAELLPGCRTVPARIRQPVVRMSPDRALQALEWKAEPRRLRLEAMLRSVRDAG